MVAANYVWSYRLPDKSRAIFCVKENRSAIRVGVRFPTVSWNISNNLTRFSSADNPLGAYTCEGECRVILSKLLTISSLCQWNELKLSQSQRRNARFKLNFIHGVNSYSSPAITSWQHARLLFLSALCSRPPQVLLNNNIVGGVILPRSEEWI